MRIMELLNVLLGIVRATGLDFLRKTSVNYIWHC